MIPHLRLGGFLVRSLKGTVGSTCLSFLYLKANFEDMVRMYLSVGASDDQTGLRFQRNSVLLLFVLFLFSFWKLLLFPVK